MAELRFQVDDTFLNMLQEQIGSTKSTDVARDALTLLNWAVKERAKGRDISSSEGGTVTSTLAMPSLDRVRSAG